jgi:uncharacterized protein (DUF1684 family)
VKDDVKWRAAVSAFRAERERKVGGDDGWVTLVALDWLKPGENSVGADPASAAVLPQERSPAHAGVITVKGAQLAFQAAPGVDVRYKGAPVRALALEDDERGAPTVLELGSLRLFVIKRGDKYGLRVKDRNHPARKDFHGLTWFPVDPAFRFRARFEPGHGASMPVENVLHQPETREVTGHVIFRVGGAEVRITAIKDDGPGLYIVFRDQTAGKETYPAGRFLDTPPPDADGTVELDFNCAYTPPCAFTPFATCPLPPRENILPFRVTAGETYHGAH